MPTNRYNAMLIDVIDKLWTYSTNQPNLVILEAAFQALSRFSIPDLSHCLSNIYHNVNKNIKKDNLDVISGNDLRI